MQPFADITVKELGGISISQLTYLHNHPEQPMSQQVETACSGRPHPKDPRERIACPKRERFKCMAYFAEFTACDDCREAYIRENKVEEQRTYWEKVCPEDFRLTDTKHAGFPGDIYASLKDWNAAESLFLFGPSGSGKTRVAILLLKRALLKGHTIGFLWPEEMKDAAKSIDRLKRLQSFGRFDVLLMDDALLTGAQDERIADFLKDLIDFMQRHRRAFIVTSQIGGSDYLDQADKFNNLTKTDRERIEALLRRLRDKCRVVPFAQPKATETTQEGHF